MAAKLLILLAIVLLACKAEADPDKNKKVKCQVKSSRCYHEDFYCPDECSKTCHANCDTCNAECPSPPSPPAYATPSPPPPPPAYVTPSPPPPAKITPSPPPPPANVTPSPPPPPANVTPSPPPPPVNVTPSPPPPPANVTPSPPPPSVTPSPPPPPANVTPSPPPPPANVTPSPPPPANVTPSPPPPTPPPSSKPKKAKCKNKAYPDCYKREFNCPVGCPDKCQVDCKKCAPVCDCNYPGAVCQDPRFVGADGLTFYFHGKKDKEFCILSDSSLHINAHFVGRRNPNLRRDFTWVQSLGILFNNHKLFIAAKTTSVWDDSVDRIELQLDGESIILPETEGSQWKLESARLTITRTSETNAIAIEVEDNFKIKALVIPITEKDSKVHNYGITQDDCFAHLDMSFKFYTLSGDVNGVLGQTYATNYASRLKMGVLMPVMGGDKEFSSSSIFSTDCEVAKFTGELVEEKNVEYASLDCASSSLVGHGVVCKR